MLGTAGLPHILIRFYTVPTAKAARKSVLWAIGIIGTFYLMTLALGFGAAALVAPAESEVARSRRQHGVATAGQALGGGVGSTGGAILLAVIAAVAFATILAVVAGLTLASSSSVAHDLYANVIKKGKVTEKDEVRVARISAFVIGAIAIVLGHPRPEPQRGLPGGAGVRGRGVGATCRRSSTACSGSGSTPAARSGPSTAARLRRGPGVLLAGRLRSGRQPGHRGEPVAVPGRLDFHWFPLENPGIVSIPLGFLFGWLGTVISKEPDAEEKYAELEVRASPAPAPSRRRSTRPGGTPISERSDG